LGSLTTFSTGAEGSVFGCAGSVFGLRLAHHPINPPMTTANTKIPKTRAKVELRIESFVSVFQALVNRAGESVQCFGDNKTLKLVGRVRAVLAGHSFLRIVWSRDSFFFAMFFQIASSLPEIYETILWHGLP
jgi:hypothetical protein